MAWTSLRKESRAGEGGRPRSWYLGRVNQATSAALAAAQLRELYQRTLDQVRGEFQENTWQAFWRTVIDGRSPSALAEALGTTPAAIRQAKSRVLRRLREEMGELIV